MSAAVTSRWAPLLGLAVWAGLVAARAPRLADEATLAELLVSFVPLVLVPLVLPMTVPGDMSPRPGRGLARSRGLTASHFHAAGFATLMMTGLLRRALAGMTAPVASAIYRVVAPALVLAFPLLAAGIGGAVRPLELAGAGLYAAFLPVLAALQIRAAIGTRGPASWRGLLVLSALAVLLATAFAMQGFYGASVPISTMLRYHALVNMLGFLGLGLLAWSRLRPAPLAGPAK